MSTPTIALINRAKARYGLTDPSPHDVIAAALGDDTPAYREAFRQIADALSDRAIGKKTAGRRRAVRPRERKVCEGCGTEFARPRHVTLKNWVDRKYCTYPCAIEHKQQRRGARVRLDVRRSA